MKAPVTILILLGILIATTESEAQRSTGIVARFKQLDKNADGKVTREEAGDPPWFDRLDRNQDGVIITDELKRPTSSPKDSSAESIGDFKEGMPLTLESCRAAADYSTEGNGHAILVNVDGRTVYERYDNDWDRDRPHRLASGTKSFAGVTAAVAVADGLITFDDKVSNTISEWQEDPKRRNITVRQLLSLTSGIEPGDNGNVLPYAKAIKAVGKHEPGEEFEYGPNPFQIFGELMRRKLSDRKLTSLDYLREKVLDPIGLKTGVWRKTVEGYPHIPSGAFITAREWVKFGEFMRSGGKWQGKELVPKSLLDQLLVGSKANPTYGITFWLSGDDDSQVPDFYMAAGAGKQRLYIIPSLKMVVVRMGESKGRQFEDKSFLKKLILPGP